MSKFAGKVAIVSGSSKGLGACIAKAFAKEGAKVTVIGRNQERLKQVADECRKFEGCEVLEIATDLSKLDNLNTIIEKTVEKFGGIDYLINNAPPAPVIKSVEEYTEEEYDAVFNVGLKTIVFLSKLALPYLKKSKGCIVNISGASAIKSFPTIVPISMSKSALDHFTRGFAAECVSYSVRVNSVNPGKIKNEDNPVNNKDNPVLAQLETKFLEIQPLGVIGVVELADVVLFICSTPHMTGSSVVVDGGVLIAG